MNVRDNTTRRTNNYYTITDFMVATGLSRTTLLQIINGRPCRNVRALVPRSERNVLLINNRWTMVYTKKAFIKVMDAIANRKVDGRYKDNRNKQRKRK